MFNVAEKFVSINGEGQRAGQLAVFIRFAGCNLNCSYCDTRWASVPNFDGEKLTAEEIFDYVMSTRVTNVTLTGGEPLLQDDIEELIGMLVQAGLWVEVETNGSVPLRPLDDYFRPHFTMDYKSPSSGMEAYMLMSNYALLESDDVVKFVCGSVDDLFRALDIIKQYGLLGKCRIYFSCVFGELEPSRVIDFMRENELNGVNFQLQMHKFIWEPDKRGV